MYAKLPFVHSAANGIFLVCSMFLAPLHAFLEIEELKCSLTKDVQTSFKEKLNYLLPKKNVVKREIAYFPNLAKDTCTSIIWMICIPFLSKLSHILLTKHLKFGIYRSKPRFEILTPQVEICSVTQCTDSLINTCFE